MISSRSIVLLASLAGLAFTAGCTADTTSPDTASEAPEVKSANAATALAAELKKAAQGLIVISESDSPLTYVEAPLAAGEGISGKLVVAKLDATHSQLEGDGLGKLSERHVKLDNFDEFIARYADDEDAAISKQWKELGKLMHDKLVERVAIRFQSSPATASDGGSITVFLGGRANGRLVGFFIEMAET